MRVTLALTQAMVPEKKKIECDIKACSMQFWSVALATSFPVQPSTERTLVSASALSTLVYAVMLDVKAPFTQDAEHLTTGVGK